MAQESEDLSPSVHVEFNHSFMSSVSDVNDILMIIQVTRYVYYYVKNVLLGLS